MSTSRERELDNFRSEKVTGINQGNTATLSTFSYFLLRSSLCFVLFCFGKLPTHNTVGATIICVMDARLGDVRWMCVTEGDSRPAFGLTTRSALRASGCARGHVSGRGTTENRGACGIVCRRCTKTKQNGDRSRNRKQIVNVAVFPCVNSCLAALADE